MAVGTATAAMAGASALGKGLGAAASSPPSYSELDDRSVTNIAPVGVNLGAIMRPFNEGSRTNGGGPRDFNRLVGDDAGDALNKATPGGEIATVPAEDPEKDRKLSLLVIGGAGVAAFLIARMF